MHIEDLPASVCIQAHPYISNLCSSISLYSPIRVDMEIVDIYIYIHRSSYTCTHMCTYVNNMRRIIYEYVC